MRTPNLPILIIALLSLSTALAEAPWPGWRVKVGAEVLEIGSIQPERLSPREVELAGEQLTATPIQNGALLSGVSLDTRADSDAWQAFLKDNASFYARSIQTLESTVKCPAPPTARGSECTCQIWHRETDKRLFRITQKVCQDGGASIADTSIEFGPTGPEAEAQVGQRIKGIDTLTDQLAGFAQARQILLEYPAVQRSKSVIRQVEELSVIGQRPTLPQLKWWQGPEIPLAEGTVALLFFEAWDPHSPNFLPSAADLLRGLGIKVIGVHKGTKNSTDEKIRAIAATFAPDAILRDSGDLSRQFEVTGIPAIAILHRGAVLWRDHPRRLNPTALQSAGTKLGLPPALPVGADACGPGNPPPQADLATAAHALAALRSMADRKGERPELPCDHAVLSTRQESWTRRLSEALRREPPPWSDAAAMTAWLTALPNPEDTWFSVWEAQPKSGQMSTILLAMSQSERVEERRAAAALLIHHEDATYATARAALVRLQEDPDLLTQRRASHAIEELDLNESTSGSEGE